jgi:hypothetical protein
MCNKTDTYILRLANTGLDTQLVTTSSDESSATIKIPAELTSKGKCKIEVISGFIQLEHSGGNRVIPNYGVLVGLRAVGLSVLGYDTQQQYTHPVVLGMGAVESNTQLATQFSAVSSPTFTCPELPPSITLERIYQSSTTAGLSVAKSYIVNPTPFNCVLQITFLEDMN